MHTTLADTRSALAAEAQPVAHPAARLTGDGVYEGLEWLHKTMKNARAVQTRAAECDLPCV